MELHPIRYNESIYNAGSSPHPTGEAINHLLLYCRVGIGYHLQILPSGSVGGVHKPTEDCEFTLTHTHRRHAWNVVSYSFVSELSDSGFLHLHQLG